MIKKELYWRSNNDWFRFDGDLNPVINDDAPEAAKESYRLSYGREKNQRKQQVAFWYSIYTQVI